MQSRKTGDMETNFEVRSFDAEITKEAYDRLPKLPLYFVLDNLRSAFNVGSIFRTCDILRVKGLFLCGYTACPPHAKLEKTALGTIDYVPWRYFETAVDAVECLKDRGIAVWAAETTSKSVSYDAAVFPDELAIVLGNEALGVSRGVLERCDGLVEIPTRGYKNSLNVGSACAVLGFKALETMEGARGGSKG
ncbi:MAG: RNA methyltransferase [Gemmatimonadota bacterium]|nr:RNA methyltransferase [Gemmatimonadota bacterium]